MSISRVITTQMSAARNALTSQFISMRKVAATQMAEILRTVNDYMDSIASACNKTLTLKVNINKTETTTKKVVEEKAGLNLAVPQTSSLASGMMRGTSNSIGLGTLVGGIAAAAGTNNAISLNIPVILEGREIAKA